MNEAMIFPDATVYIARHEINNGAITISQSSGNILMDQVKEW